MAARFEDEFELVDIRVQLPGESIDWLEPANGLNIVYGRNGSGKSTLLKALTGGSQESVIFLRGISTDEMRPSTRDLWLALLERLPYNLADSDGYLQPANNVESWSYVPNLTPDEADPFVAENLTSNRLTDLAISDLLSALESFEQEVASKFVSASEDISSSPFSSTADLEQSFGEVRGKLNSIRREISEVRQIPHHILLEQRHTLKDARTALRDAIYEGVQLGDVSKFIGEDGALPDGVIALEGTTRQIAEAYLGERHIEILVQKHSLPLRKILAADGFRSWSNYYGWDLEDDEPPIGELFEDNEEIVATFSNALQLLLSDNQIAFSQSDTSLWNPAYWTRIPEDSGDFTNRDVKIFFRRIRAFIKEYPTGIESLDAHAGAVYMMALNNEPLASRERVVLNKYLLVSPNASSIDLPFRVVDLDADLNLQLIAQNLLSLANQQVDVEFDSSVEFVDAQDDTRIEGEPGYVISVPNPHNFRLRPRAKSRVDAMMTAASVMLQGLDIGLRRIDLEMHLDMSSLISRRQPQFRFVDSTGSRKWIAFDALSSAQQRWVKMLLQILMNAWSPRRFCLFVSDEPDAGVHQGAVRQSLEFLASLPTPSIVASHSPVSFQIDHAHLVHLSSSEHGVRSISLPILSEDVSTAAQELGVSTIDLLALKKLLVVCEGEHDVAVIQGLLRLSADPKLQQRTLVVAARGVRNLLSTPSTRIITEYTNLQVLHVADNVNSNAIANVITNLRKSDEAGLHPKQILHESGLQALRNKASPEERVMFDLLEQCVQRRLLSRFHVFGLGKRDIIEYLPASEFGLPDDWVRLRADYSSFKSDIPLDFKKWLISERQASISTRRVEAAFEKLDALHGDLAELLTEMAVLSAVGTLR
jgi:energy-coupling factor transporter ATP-binding protein EcfA2